MFFVFFFYMEQLRVSKAFSSDVVFKVTLKGPQRKSSIQRPIRFQGSLGVYRPRDWSRPIRDQHSVGVLSNAGA